MFTIENEYLKVEIASKGAELNRLFSKAAGTDYLWSGDAQYWGKKSPVLFPIVGTLKNNTYRYNGQAYQLTRHGFARDMEFTVSSQAPSSISFVLEHNDDTLAKYPFPFRLEISYTLQTSALFVQYAVTNTGVDNMYFSIGGHPAFRVPIDDKLHFDDYYFEFSSDENALRWPISREGLINPDATILLKNEKQLHISRELFERDAIVLKHLNSEMVKLKSDRSPHGLDFFFPGFPFLGLWSYKNGDFVCIEPWCGIADSTTTNQELINKEGINLLTPDAVFQRQWSVRVY